MPWSLAGAERADRVFDQSIRIAGERRDEIGVIARREQKNRTK
jgi:hypothetical protein